MSCDMDRHAHPNQPVGLPNPLGWQTCYLNSSLQAMQASPSMTQFIKQLAKAHTEGMQRHVTSTVTHRNPSSLHTTLPSVASFQRVRKAMCSFIHGQDCPRKHASSLAVTGISDRAVAYHLSQACILQSSSNCQPTQAVITGAYSPSPQGNTCKQHSSCTTSISTNQSCPPVHSDAVLLMALHGLFQRMESQAASRADMDAGGHDRLQLPRWWRTASKAQESVPVHMVRAVVQGMSTHTHSHQLTLGDQQDALEALQALWVGLETEAHLILKTSQKGLLGLLPSHLAVPWQSPCQGTMAHWLTCRECGNPSLVSLTPFFSLSLTIPTHVNSVTGIYEVFSTHILDCLKELVQPSSVSSVTCNRCTLTAAAWATRRHAHLLPRQPVRVHQSINTSPSSADNISTSQGSISVPSPEALVNHLISYTPLPDLELEPVLAALGQGLLPKGFNVKGMAVQHTAVPHLPKVLCLHLQRSIWNAYGVSKVHGHVAFPATLEAQVLHNLLNSDVQSMTSRLASYNKENSNHCVEDDEGCPPWHLVSVISHLGMGSGGGHYIVYRQSSKNVISEADNSCARFSSRSHSQNSWWRISDSVVSPVDLNEVLACHASVLIYEQVERPCNT